MNSYLGELEVVMASQGDQAPLDERTPQTLQSPPAQAEGPRASAELCNSQP